MLKKKKTRTQAGTIPCTCSILTDYNLYILTTVLLLFEYCGLCNNLIIGKVGIYQLSRFLCDNCFFFLFIRNLVIKYMFGRQKKKSVKLFISVLNMQFIQIEEVFFFFFF